jgi:hypothetical protein
MSRRLTQKTDGTMTTDVVKSPQFVVGSSLLVGYLGAIGSTSTVAVLFGIGTLVDLGFNLGHTLTLQFVMVAAIIGVAATLTYRGIDTSVRVSVTLAFACIPVVLGVPVILITSLGIFGLCIVAGCLLEAPLVQDHAIDLDNGVSPLAIIARQGYWPALGTLGDAFITMASTAATIAFCPAITSSSTSA